MTLPDPDDITEAVRAFALGQSDADQDALLEDVGLVFEGELTARGEVVEDAYFIRESPAEVEDILSEAYRRLPLVQALVQGFHGRGPIPITGVMHFLMRHRLAEPDDSLSDLRASLSILNGLDLVAYSNKHQTLRITTETSFEDEPSPLVRVIERDRPYSNVRHVREILRECRDFIWWADPHLDRKVFEPLADEANGEVISEIRIVSGPARIGKRTKSDFRRFREEMAGLSIEVAWHVVAEKDWHDRFILTKDKVWNVPPLNTVYIGDYSEAFQTPEEPPFEEWFESGVLLERWGDD